jgi:ribonuclease VapC
MNEQRVVLDTSAFLALAHREAGHRLVAERILDSFGVMSAVNVTEVLSKQADVGIPATEAIALFHLTGVRIVSFGLDEAMFTASLRQATRPLGLSLGDRACLALGLRLNCPILTADRVWSELEIGVEIVQIR